MNWRGENRESQLVRDPVAKLLITWEKSAIGYSKEQRVTLKTMGLRRLNQAVVHNDSPEIRGMINKVRHLVHVEEASEE
jgi:large subunit ribosomal protein L30